MPDNNLAVRLEDITKVYRLEEFDFCALNGVTLHIPHGEYLAIMGPSGSGKTTLLNLLGCLDKPTSGAYFLENDDVSTLSDDRLSEIRNHKIGFIFQSYNLIPQLTVLENIALPLFYRQSVLADDLAKAEALAGLVGLKDKLKNRPSQLSGGQQQRVAIARSLINDPLIILADEPTGNLDSVTGTEILGIMDRLHEEGRTLIVITPDPDVAHRTSRVIHLMDGRINQGET